jgi:hypothetical protein|tara:strand:+ start:154 stop:642 length:489 start_codon:yes stop_codon:yes gene_type:complete
MELKESKEILNTFAKYVIQQSRSNLTKSKKNVSKALYDSLDYEIMANKDFISLSFSMLDYGEYQDQGVSGTKKNYNTPFRYTNKMPPAKAFDKWTVRKGIAPRGSGGKFQKRKGINFAIAKHIFEQGIRPSLFFTKPFEKRFDTMLKQLENALGGDIENTIT